MLDLVYLVSPAMSAAARTNAGMIKWWILSQRVNGAFRVATPPVGNQLFWTAKTMIRIKPRKKFGVATPRKDVTVTV